MERQAPAALALWRLIRPGAPRANHLQHPYRLLARHDVRCLATGRSSGGWELPEDPWLCVPVSRRVCRVCRPHVRQPSLPVVPGTYGWPVASSH